MAHWGLRLMAADGGDPVAVLRNWCNCVKHLSQCSASFTSSALVSTGRVVKSWSRRTCKVHASMIKSHLQNDRSTKPFFSRRRNATLTKRHLQDDRSTQLSHVDTIVSTYLYIDYYSIIWINYLYGQQKKRVTTLSCTKMWVSQWLVSDAVTCEWK